jgi:hypothetical protein
MGGRFDLPVRRQFLKWELFSPSVIKLKAEGNQLEPHRRIQMHEAFQHRQ